MPALSVSLAFLIAAFTSPADTIAPGHSALKSVRVRIGVDTTEVFSVANGTQRRMNTSIQSVTKTGSGFLITHYMESQRGTMVDSTWVDSGTFATRRHIDISPLGRKQLGFQGRHITGVTTDSTGDHPIDITLERDALDNSIAGILMTGLPSTTASPLVFSTYDVAGNLSYVTVRVLGKEATPGAADAKSALKIAMDFSSSGREWSVFHWVDEATRKELRWELSIQGRGMLGVSR